MENFKMLKRSNSIRFIFQNTHSGSNIEKKVRVVGSEYGDDWRLDLKSNNTYGKK